jgi:hypothetical protein
MRILRDRYRRSAWGQYFDGLDAIDRQTFYVAVVLAFACALSFAGVAYR